MKTLTFAGQTLVPSKIICLGRNYAAHALELANEVPQEPVIFIKPNSAIATALYCGLAEVIHYEAEICFAVIDNRIAAVGLGLDLTKREVQNNLKRKGLPWERSKCFDGAAVFSEFISYSGPCDDLSLELWINGIKKQSGGVRQMMTHPQAFLTEAQSFMTLENGDLLMTGTPEGVGPVTPGDQLTGKLFDGGQLLIAHTWVAVATTTKNQ